MENYCLRYIDEQLPGVGGVDPRELDALLDEFINSVSMLEEEFVLLKI